MEESLSVQELGNRVLDFRREFGFSKRLPYTIQNEVSELLASGISAALISRTIGVPRATVSTWGRTKPSALDPSKLKEIKIQSPDSVTEYRISKVFKGCRIEVSGADFSVLQDLIKKLGVG